MKYSIQSQQEKSRINNKLKNNKMKNSIIKNNEKMNVKPIKIKTMKKIGRNEKCICGSGKKYKKCCLGN